MKIKIMTILAGFLIGSFAYNLNVDNENIMGIPSYQISWLTIGIGTLIGTFMIRVFSNGSTSVIALLFYAGIMIAIIVRIVYDSFLTSRTHSLAPLEIIIYSIITLPVAFIGTYLGRLLKLKNTR